MSDLRVVALAVAGVLAWIVAMALTSWVAFGEVL